MEIENAVNQAKKELANRFDFRGSKAEIALEYPNKFYIGTFERTARFDAHLDKAGVSLMLERTGDAAEKKAVRMHFHYALFAEILQELAKTASAMPEHDADHREALRDGDLVEPADTGRAWHRCLRCSRLPWIAAARSPPTSPRRASG